MPYADEEKQNEAVKAAMRRYRARKQAGDAEYLSQGEGAQGRLVR